MNKLRSKKFSRWQYILYSKVFLVICLVFLGFIITVITRDLLQKSSINNEIENLEGQAKELALENEKLSDVIDYYNSESFIETEAKKKLGLSKQGEKAVIISDNEIEKMINSKSGENTNNQINTENLMTEISEKPNYLLWLEYYFN